MNTIERVARAARPRGATVTVARADPVPGESRELTALERMDYADCFAVDGGVSDRSPEGWAHAILEDTAGILGQLVWRGPVGLRLRRGPTRIAGWTVTGSGDDWIRVQAQGVVLTAELVIRADAGHASVATFIRYDRAIAAATWPPVAVAHRIGLPVLLRRAAGSSRSAT